MNDWFWRQDRKAQDDILETVRKAMLWRGWDAIGRLGGGELCRCNARMLIREVADILSRNGLEMEEYT